MFPHQCRSSFRIHLRIYHRLPQVNPLEIQQEILELLLAEWLDRLTQDRVLPLEIVGWFNCHLGGFRVNLDQHGVQDRQTSRLHFSINQIAAVRFSDRVLQSPLGRAFHSLLPGIVYSMPAPGKHYYFCHREAFEHMHPPGGRR